MPVITSSDRVKPVSEENYQAPKKTISVSTGMDLTKSVSGAVQEPSRQLPVVEETKLREATLSPQLTALARKESKLRQQEQAFKAREAAVTAKEAEFGKLTELKAKLAVRDYSILDEIGIDYNDYTNYAVQKLNGSNPQDEAIKKLESDINRLEEASKQNVNKQYEATINQYRRDVKNLVESDPSYDSIKVKGAQEHVVQHIVDTFNEDGEVLTIQQAAKEVEETILEEAREYLKLSKLQSELKPKEQEKKLPPPKQQTRTLTNQITQANPSAPRNQFQHMSMKERIAIAASRAQKT